ncbi:unnamed protein product, partial [Urochloa humidicola]
SSSPAAASSVFPDRRRRASSPQNLLPAPSSQNLACAPSPWPRPHLAHNLPKSAASRTRHLTSTRRRRCAAARGSGSRSCLPQICNIRQSWRWGPRFVASSGPLLSGGSTAGGGGDDSRLVAKLRILFLVLQDPSGGGVSVCSGRRPAGNTRTASCCSRSQAHCSCKSRPQQSIPVGFYSPSACRPNLIMSIMSIRDLKQLDGRMVKGTGKVRARQFWSSGRNARKGA